MSSKTILRCPSCNKQYSDQEKRISHLFNLCPYCGELFPRTLRTIRSYLDLIDLHPALKSVKTLLCKGELTAGAREALIVLESYVRERLGRSDLKGKVLMSKAFSFEFDKAKNEMVRKPLIMITDLSTESKRNEQEGILQIALGLMAGARNILMHHQGTVIIGNALSVVSAVHLVLHHIEGFTPISRIR